MDSSNQNRDPDDKRLVAAIDAYAAGDDGAADYIHEVLRAPVYAAARRFLHADNIDLDDVVQDTLMAIYAYLRRNHGFTGDLVKFAITVARNRCRNLLNWRKVRPQTPVETMAEWLADSEKSPLDSLLDAEVRTILQTALDRLDSTCRALLHAFYLEEKTIEEIRGEIGLKTVQGIYYRRAICLRKIYGLLKKRLTVCSSERGADS